MSFRPGDTIDLGDGYYLEITKNAVLAKCKNGAYNPNRMKEVSDIAGALNTFIRFANGQTGSMYFDEVQQSRITPLLSKLGIRILVQPMEVSKKQVVLTGNRLLQIN